MDGFHGGTVVWVSDFLCPPVLERHPAARRACTGVRRIAGMQRAGAAERRHAVGS